MELKSSTTSVASSLRVELDELEELLESKPIGGGGGGPCMPETPDAPEGACDSSVLTADWAVLMSPLDSAELTLDRNCPMGLEVSALAGESDSTCVR